MARQVFNPHEYQRDCIRFMLENPAGGLLLDPGLGKTSTTLAALEILKEEGISKRILIVATLKIIYSVWPKEIEKWGFDFAHTILHGKSKERGLAQDVDIYLINYDGLPWLAKQKKFLKSLDTLVLDESSKVKGYRTLRFKTLKGMLNHFDRRYILTGSPAPNGLMDLFSQIYVLDGGAALGRFITHYRNEYFYPSGYKGYEYQLQPGAEERIYENIRHLVIRYDDSLIKTPELVDNPIEVELPPKVRRQYDDMEQFLVAEVKDGKVLASNAGVKTQKLRQIANGHLRDEAGSVHLLHEAKIEALRELIEELQGSPLLVTYEFKPDLEMLLKAFGTMEVGGRRYKTPFIGGGCKPSAAQEIERRWNANQVPLLFGQVSVIAHGLNLQDGGGHNIAFYGQTWNLEDYYQVIRRLKRQGNKSKHVIAHHLLAANSVDYDVITARNSKDKTQRSLLNAFKKRTGLR